MLSAQVIAKQRFWKHLTSPYVKMSCWTQTLSRRDFSSSDNMEWVHPRRISFLFESVGISLLSMEKGIKETDHSENSRKGSF